MISSQLHSFLETLALGISFPEQLSSCLDDRYLLIQIRKLDGRKRILKLPNEQLKWVQTRILKDWLQPNFVFPDFVQGGIKGRSPKTNANLHLGNPVVLNLDLYEFFESITAAKVENSLKRLSFPTDLRKILAQLTTYAGTLPQGAPTSSFLANLATLDLDEKLIKISEQYGAAYSRYVDDLTFSGDIEVDVFLKKIHFCIKRNGFVVNKKKTKIQRKHTRQTVNKVVVNNKASVSRKLIRQIRQELFYCGKFGIEGHKMETSGKQHFSAQRLAAQIGYVNSIDPELGGILLQEFKKLQNWTGIDRHFQKMMAEQNKLSI